MGRGVVWGLYVALAFAGQASFGADEDLLLRALTNPDTVADAFADLPLIRGKVDKDVGVYRGLRCQGGSRVSLDWAFSVQGVKTGLDSTGNTTVELSFAKPDIFARILSRDGLFCVWGGEDGRVELGRVVLKMHLVPNSRDRFPGLSVDALRLEGFDMTQVSVGWPGFFTIHGNVPAWFDRWTEANLNLLFKDFFASVLKRRLDDYLTSELAKRLGDRTGLERK